MKQNKIKMKRIVLTIFLYFGSVLQSNLFLGQYFTQYNPQELYDAPDDLYELDSIRNLYVNFLEPNYHDTLVNSYFNNPSYRLPATITLNGTVLDSVGVRYKGNSTFCLAYNDLGIPKLPYNLDFNEWISGQKLMDRKKIKLSNALFDPTFAKEVIAFDIYNKYLPSPEANLIKLHVQGNYLGLYVNTENIDKTFLKKHFGEKDGAFFKCDPNMGLCTTPPPVYQEPTLQYLGADSSLYSSYDIKSDYGWTELIRFIDTLNNNPSALGEVLNIDRVLWNFALNAVTASFDTYNHGSPQNFYLYQTGDGLFQMIPWDNSEAFLGLALGDLEDEQELFEYDPYEISSTYPLESVILSNPLYRKQYTAHIRTIINESFDANVIAADVSQLQSDAFNPANDDIYKMFDMNAFTSNVQQAYVYVPWQWAVGGIISTVNGRKNYLLNHPEISSAPPTISNINVSSSHITAEINNSTVVDLMATLSEFNSKFEAFTMTDDGLNGDSIAGDGIFTAPVPFVIGSNEQMKFYIRAQNNDAMSLSPERAEYEFYFYSPSGNLIIEENLTNDELKVYPNPSNDFITIASMITNPVEFNLYNTFGKLVMNGIIHSNNQQLSLSNLSTGCYYLKAGKQVIKILKK